MEVFDSTVRGDGPLGIVERAVERRRKVARELVEAHDRHDPSAIARVQETYSLATTSRNTIEQANALAELAWLDEAGLTCEHCAPSSACEIEAEAKERTPRRCGAGS